MRKKLKYLPVDLFANPKFIGNTLNFTQDKVTIINNFLENSELVESKKIIDEYINLQKTFWSLGIHDAVYKLQSNYGINSNEKVVCIDFGEFIFDRQKVLENVQKQGWLKRSTYKNWPDSETKKYYTQKMKENMNVENIEKYWTKN